MNMCDLTNKYVLLPVVVNYSRLVQLMNEVVEKYYAIYSC